MTTLAQLGDDTKRIFESFDNFKNEITKIYSDPDQYWKMAASIQWLQQTRSVQNYIFRFYTLAVKTEWDNDALLAVYYKGLKEQIKDELSREELTKDIDDMVRRVVQIDNRLQEKRMER